MGKRQEVGPSSLAGKKTKFFTLYCTRSVNRDVSSQDRSQKNQGKNLRSYWYTCIKKIIALKERWQASVGSS